jgi:hypothetical protein
MLFGLAAFGFFGLLLLWGTLYPFLSGKVEEANDAEEADINNAYMRRNHR